MTYNTVTFTPVLPNENLYLVVGRFDGEENIRQVYSALTEELAIVALTKHIGYLNDTEEDNENIIIDSAILLSEMVVQPSCSHKELLEKLPPAAIHAELDEDHTPAKIIIDGEAVNDEVFDDNLVNWILEGREEVMDKLISWIAEFGNSDSHLMKQDLFMLAGLDDNYVWSSNLTNEYISPSKNPEKFNEVCRKVLAANSQLGL